MANAKAIESQSKQAQPTNSTAVRQRDPEEEAASRDDESDGDRTTSGSGNCHTGVSPWSAVCTPCVLKTVMKRVVAGLVTPLAGFIHSMRAA